ncbi:MAG: HAD-IIIA family hydrolase [Bdellovibrionales bacterium]|nr:HAD-IIIA family hydrolase [Bdellovibrionales bacterium]
MKKLKLADFSEIKAVVTDVDGIWTNGSIWLDSTGNSFRSFYIHDGYGVKNILKAGFKVALISGSKAEDIKARAEKLGVSEIHIGVEDKLPVFKSLLKKWDLSEDQVLYIGDDQPDVEILDRVGIAVTVPNCHISLKEKGYYSTELNGGEGALRELCDLLVNEKEG